MSPDKLSLAVAPPRRQLHTPVAVSSCRTFSIISTADTEIAARLFLIGDQMPHGTNGTVRGMYHHHVGHQLRANSKFAKNESVSSTPGHTVASRITHQIIGIRRFIRVENVSRVPPANGAATAATIPSNCAPNAKTSKSEPSCPPFSNPASRPRRDAVPNRSIIASGVICTSTVGKTATARTESAALPPDLPVLLVSIPAAPHPSRPAPTGTGAVESSPERGPETRPALSLGLGLGLSVVGWIIDRSCVAMKRLHCADSVCGLSIDDIGSLVARLLSPLSLSLRPHIRPIWFRSASDSRTLRLIAAKLHPLAWLAGSIGYFRSYKHA